MTVAELCPSARCTGTTFTALKIAERTALDQGGSARILFAVPSISLLVVHVQGGRLPASPRTRSGARFPIRTGVDP